MIVRRESPTDVPAVRAVTAAAFAAHAAGAQAGREPVEVTLIGRLREDPDWVPELSLVAVSDDDVDETRGQGTVIGHVLCSRGRVGETRALGLGPLSVAPEHQGRGVGSALMHAALGAADALGAPFVALLGEPAFYRRFGFRPASHYGIAAPDPAWGEYFQVRTLSAYDPAAARGTFAYAAPFDRLDEPPADA
ncbi:GNAT family N-acetyltransferase [Streptomonospora nanhaiensis]|uniref:Putative acetyltransferase n=1 Tax=Streptomonospora nanhaiensis TaxID=1323731 RepID=A0A853BGV6_9ACTN|nr:N-acetyltransferase [Streptomonospora nanhaiensis]MBV2366603.1 N-acetyltransferase [Streptomonospora nanhaiensis]MBX9388606.1 N-acetyltransferase [Streptomonospora nanhaiensis]NYI93842.1 putative acetyltransferase [Streptomonospora nanhaiensis]